MKWAKFNCGLGNDAYADKFLALPGDYWAQIDVYIPASTLTACDGELRDYTAFLLSILGATHVERDAIYGHSPDGGATWEWATDDGGSTLPGLTPGATHTLKVHWDGVHATWYVDGTSFSVNSVSPAPTGGIRIGAYFSEGCGCEWYFVTNVKVGTSDGASDIFSEDFTGGDFSAFTSTSGLCLVVAAPTSCVAPPLSLAPSRGCFGDVITVTGSGFTPSSPVTATLDGYLPVTLSPAVTDGSGNISATFTIPPAGACGGCTATLYIVDADDNIGQVTLQLCCARSGDTLDANYALPPVVATDNGILDYIHHDGNHYVLVATGPDNTQSTTFPPDWTLHAATVYVIPDDGSGVTSFPVDTDICWTFSALGYAAFDPPTWFLRSFGFSSWDYPIYDARFASDGTNLWLAVLTAKTEEYPYISSDDGDGVHTSQSAQFVDLATMTSGYTNFSSHARWVRTDTGTLSAHIANPPYSDSGDCHTGYWTTPRLRLYNISTVAATSIGYIDALYYPGTVTPEFSQPGAANTFRQSNVMSGVSIAASPTEVGVCHVVWSEGGARGRYGAFGGYGDGTQTWDEGPPDVDWRVNYSKWGPGALVSQSDLWHTHIDRTGWFFTYDGFVSSHPYGYFYGYSWPTTAEFAGAFSNVFQVVNDGGSPVLFIAPAATDVSPGSAPNGDPDPHGNPWLDNNPNLPDPATFAAYDISTGAPVLMQTFDPALLPAAAETPIHGVPSPVTSLNRLFTAGFNDLVTIGVSLPYADPLLSGQPVYLLSVPWWGPDISGGYGSPQAIGFYRIPVDLSAAFDYLDGIAFLNYSIVAGATYSAMQSELGGGRFWSDAHGVWVPGGYHLDRECQPIWNQFYGYPFQRPFYWDGSDYVYSMQLSGGGSPNPYKVTRTHICRACAPCSCGAGIYVWQRF